MGGTQSLHTNSRDEALALPTEESALLALRTQQVVAHESGVARVADPLGGAYAVEALTRELVARSSALIQRIDERGGALQAIESGFIQKEIQDAAYEAQRAIEDKRQIVVGVNDFVTAENKPIPLLTIDPSVEADQVERLRAFRSRRSAEASSRAARALTAAARDGTNLMPLLVDAVDAGVTLGEIVDSLRPVFGEYHEHVTLP
jgi:methylmalonyl-CoA mutase, N-terminal domain